MAEPGEILIRWTVLLETAWVLKRGYRLDSSRILETFRHLAGLPGVVIEDAASAAQAFEWAAAGMDIADALHIARLPACDAFISFDRALARVAERVGTPVPVRPPI
jgi:predicted nucleic-acid-binding protein